MYMYMTDLGVGGVDLPLLVGMKEDIEAGGISYFLPFEEAGSCLMLTLACTFSLHPLPQVFSPCFLESCLLGQPLLLYLTITTLDVGAFGFIVSSPSE